MTPNNKCDDCGVLLSYDDLDLGDELCEACRQSYLYNYQAERYVDFSEEIDPYKHLIGDDYDG